MKDLHGLFRIVNNMIHQTLRNGDLNDINQKLNNIYIIIIIKVTKFLNIINIYFLLIQNQLYYLIIFYLFYAVNF